MAESIEKSVYMEEKDKKTYLSNTITTNIRKKSKENTKLLFVQAAERIIHEEGYKSLGINKVAKLAGRSKRLLYDYFGGIEGVLLAILQKNDQWLAIDNPINVELHKENEGRELSGLILKSHFNQFYNNPLLQEISLLELTEKSDFLLGLANAREKSAEKIFNLSEDYFIDTNVDIRSVEAVLIAGINYLILHSKANGSTFCGININAPDQQTKFLKTLEQITKWAYENAKKNQEMELNNN